MPESATLIAGRLLLAGAFLVAAVAKLRDPAGSRQALEDFQIARPLIPVLRLALPVAELATAAALLPRASAVPASITAALLLAAFLAVLLTSLARGRRPACHCFGRLDSTPISWRTVARTGALEGVALFVVFAGRTDPGPGIVDVLNGLSPADRIAAPGLAAVVALLGWQALQLASLRRDVDELRAALGLAARTPAAAPPPEFRWPSPHVGTPAPAFSLPGIDGVVVTLDALRSRGTPVAILFTDAACGSCRELLPDLRRWQQDEVHLTTVLISRGDAEATRALAGAHGLTRVLIEKDREVSTFYGAIGTPSALVVQADGTVASELVAGLEAIRNLVEPFVPDAPSLAPLSPSETAAPSPALTWGTTPEAPEPAAALPPDAQPAKDECVDDELLGDGTMVLYNRCHHRALTLNATAALVWESCDGRRDVPAIAAELREVFGADANVEGHVHDVLQQLLEAGMIARPGGV